MDKIISSVSTQSEDFKKQKEAFKQLLSDYQKILAEVKKGGPAAVRKKHKDRGKLLARERIDQLLDKGTTFMELSALAAYGIKDNEFPSAGIITGIGTVHGKETVIVANDATVKGGTYIAQTIKKHLRAQQIAMENQLPCVYMVDSGGVFLPEQSEVFGDREHFGRFFYNQARMSAMGIPQIAIVMGSCTAGGAYVPAMCDETIIVKGQGTIFIGGPPLVKAATGADVNAEELGGAEMHTAISGTADHLATDDADAIRICRNIFETLRNRPVENLEKLSEEPPAYDPTELYGIAPIDLRKPLDPREIIARIVDGSRFHEFKQRYGGTLVTGFAYIKGYPVGIIANNGILFGESALKGTHFIELCTSRKIPLLFLQNVMGFMVGKHYEQRGIAKDGAKMVHAVANANVPKFSVIFGGSFGAGNYAMAGRAYDPRLLFMWPNSRISVMGGAQASAVLSIVKKEQLEAKGLAFSEEEKRNIHESITGIFEKEGSPYFSTARIWDDGIIDPVQTREMIARGIRMSLYAPYGQHHNGIIRM